MRTKHVGSPGSIADYLSNHMPHFSKRWVVFQYCDRSPANDLGIQVLGQFHTRREANENFQSPTHVIVDVCSYDCTID